MKQVKLFKYFKWLFAFCFIFMSSINSFADQCITVTKQSALIALSYLKQGTLIYNYCPPCGDNSPKPGIVQNVQIFKLDFSSADSEIFVNGEVIDLAYTYVPILGGKYRNLAFIVRCPSTDVPEYLPAEISDVPAPASAPAPAPAPTREYQSSASTEKHVYFEPLRRIPDEKARQYVEDLRNWIEGMYPTLKSTFIFPDFNIYVRYCGEENAYSNPNIILCNELIAKLYNAKLSHALKWTFLHELGHTLLRLWDYPLWDNEDAADEFATVFLLIWDGENGKNIAKWAAYEFRTQSPHILEYLGKIFMNARHSFSVQRSRNIENWINNEEELKRRWLRILVPHLQTQVLEKMLAAPAPWVDTTLVSHELRNRQQFGHD